MTETHLAERLSNKRTTFKDIVIGEWFVANSGSICVKKNANEAIMMMIKKAGCDYSIGHVFSYGSDVTATPIKKLFVEYET